jgi:signal transduction histidine kinase
MRDGQGPITMWIGSNTDITEQKDLERQKEAFLGMVTHELKTPLTALLGNVQITQRGLRRLQNLLDPEQAEQHQVFSEMNRFSRFLGGLKML